MAAAGPPPGAPPLPERDLRGGAAGARAAVEGWSSIAFLEVQKVSKSYGAVRALAEVSLEVAEGEMLTLLGPSGSGKSTLIHLVAGYDRPASGRVRLAGQDLTDLPPQQRGMGMVFQQYALFPHLTVADNVAFGLTMRRKPRDEVRRRVADMLDLVGLAGLDRRRPRELSGGQQQRVALARALVFVPRVLLLDEPLTALDAKLRFQLQGELRDLQRRLGTTTLFVTHDQEEALGMSDRVAVLRDGRLQQVGTPQQLYDQPENPFVADFLGSMNFLRVDATGQVEGEPLRLPVAGPATVGIRPERLRLVPGDDARIEQVRFAGNTQLVFLRLPGGTRLMARCPAAGPTGPSTGLAWDEEHLRVFPA